MESSDIQFGDITTSRGAQVVIEPPVRMSSGFIDVDKIGAFTYIGENANIQFLSSIGRYCSIGKSIVVGEHEHPINFLSTHPMFYTTRMWKEVDTVNDFYTKNQKAISGSSVNFRKDNNCFTKGAIGNDVWIGDGVFIKKGISIGDGAIIAARSVVTKNVEPYSIVGGVPAKLIKKRFNSDIIEKLIKLEWWNYSLNDLSNLCYFDIELLIKRFSTNIKDHSLVFKTFKSYKYINLKKVSD